MDCTIFGRVLIVGLGSIGKRHLRIARKLIPSADIRVVRHERSGTTPEYANGVFYRMQDAVDFRPQLAVIANPAPFHAKAAIALAGAGAHLLIEKPLASSYDDAKKILLASRSSRSVCQVGYNLRFFPSLLKFKELLSQDIVGSIKSVRCEAGQHLRNWRLDKDYRDTVSANSQLGGGVLLELSHELDYLRWIFGEFSWVSARLLNHGCFEIDVEDTAYITAGIKAGNDVKEMTLNLNIDFVRFDTTRMCTAIGANGSLRWNAIQGTIERYEPDGVWEIIFTMPTERDDSYISEWLSWLEAISSSRPPEISLEDGLRTIALVEAIRKSNSSLSNVFLEDFVP